MNSKIKKLQHENEELKKELRKEVSMLGKSQKREQEKDELIRKLRHEKGHVKGGGNVSIGVDGTMSVETVDGGTF